MFIQNKNGEVVNADHILAVKVDDNKNPYEIHVFTEKSEVVFWGFETKEAVDEAMDKIERHMRTAYWHWIMCQNWFFRADKLMSIEDEPCRNLTISMVGRNFHVYTDAKDDETLREIKKQFSKHLNRHPHGAHNLEVIE